MPSSPYGEIFRQALTTAALWHADQKKKVSDASRDPKVPYISHLMTVSALVWDAGGNETEAIAALLHDAVEDGHASLDEVHDLFGDDVARIVDHCSDATPEPGEEKAPWFVRKVHHVNRLRDIAVGTGAEPTMVVVGADKLSNVRSILVDHRAGADDLWDRFKGGLGGSVWYYSQMADVVNASLPGSMPARELRLAVSNLTAVMDEMAAGFGGADARVAEALGDAARVDGLDATAHLAFEIVRLADGASVDQAVGAVLGNWFGADHGLDEVSARVIESLAD